MMNSGQKIYLPPEAIELLQLIEKNEDLTIKQLEEKSGKSRGKLEYYLPLLIENELIERIELEEQYPILTEEGKKAAENELVERRIIHMLEQKKKLSFQELASYFEKEKKSMNAGIGLLKKQDIISIKQGKIVLEKVNTNFNVDLQNTLRALSEGTNIEKTRTIQELEKRNLVEIRVEKVSRLKRSSKYRTLKNRIKEKNEVSRLTPEMIRDGSWKTLNFKSYNLKVNPPSISIGRKQPYARFIDEVKQKLIGLGFQEMRGSVVELEFWNFDTLFQAQDHPAREWSDVYRVSKPQHGELPKEKYVNIVKQVHQDGYDTGSKGWRYTWDPKKAARLVLRAQGTSVSARTLVNPPIPSRYFSISRCFRPDPVDTTHLSEFNQVEGIIVAPKITFRDLLGVLETFALDVAESDHCIFKPDYYPFTEPSIELSVKDPNLGPVEFGGAGLFRPEVLRPFGINVPVVAWGLGIDRLFMVKHGITDIRELFSHKLSWLRNTKMT